MDTICAISTPSGVSGIGIIRITGPKTYSILNKIFLNREKRPALVSKFKSHTVHYGFIKGERIIDEVLLTIMRSPRSYTREDMAEIGCHGGYLPLRRVLNLLLEEGCRLAEPGEFTKRAFLNGRIDLAQAEAVLQIINSLTEKGLEASLSQLEGGLSKEIRRLRSQILSLVAEIEAGIDFPEEDLKVIGRKEVEERLKKTIEEIAMLLSTAKEGEILREGLSTAIIGRTNVGKSSLFNALCGKERAIVTQVPGTTRDTIEEFINIKGIPLRIVDTAGIRKVNALVEREGVSRSKEWLRRADLVLLLLDSSESLKREDIELLKEIKDKRGFVLLNKIDLPTSPVVAQSIEHIVAATLGSPCSGDLYGHHSKDKPCGYKLPDKSGNYANGKKILRISALHKKGLLELKESIYNLISQEGIFERESQVLLNARHTQALQKAERALKSSLRIFKDNLSLEFLIPDLRAAISYLDNITGEEISQEILNEIFSRFCIGK